MDRIGSVVWTMAAGLLLGCGDDGPPKAAQPREEAKAAAAHAPPPPRATTAYLFAPATAAAGDVPPAAFEHSCQPDVGGRVRDPVPLGGPLRSRGKPPVLYHDTLSLLPAPLRCVIQNKSDWTEIRILGSLRLPRTFQGVGFGQETVLVAAMGPQPTAGYDIHFDSLAVRNDTLFAFVHRAAPHPGSVLTAGSTSPVEVIRIPKHNGPVVFVEQ
jgi:PrcB C-terminal